MKTAEMPGVAGTGGKSKLAGYFEDAWADVYNANGRGTKEIMHFPSYFWDDNNKAYELGEAVMSDYKGLVMTKYPDDKRDRFHIMLPCKTDLVVQAHAAAEGFCKCEELSLTNEVIYKLQRISCVFKDMFRVAPINADGTCPKTYTWEGTEHEIDPKWYDWNIMFPCDVDEDQEECIYRNTHDDPCTDDNMMMAA